jgi:hypothetical protein
MVDIVQSSFARGEIGSALLGRIDTRAYSTGLKKARNAVVHQFGSVSNRPGQYFIGPVRDHDVAPRLIPFKFNTTDTHILEFGHQYIRFIRNDAHITESSKTVNSISNANPGSVNVTSHGYSTGDEVVLTVTGGDFSYISGRRFLITSTGANTFTLQDQATGANFDTTTLGTFTSGTVARIYTISSPYSFNDLRRLKYVQTADVMTITHPSYAPKELRRLALANWELVDITFRPTMTAPNGLVATGGTGSATAYKVTAISDENEEESLAATSTVDYAITAATAADPVVVTITGHTFENGDEVEIASVVGMTQLNNRRFTVANKAANTIELLGEDGTDFDAYVSGGTVTACFELCGADTDVDLTWNAVSGAARYRVFKLSQGVYGFIATTEANAFTDPGNITPDLGDTPPRLFEPFFGDDNRPGAVGFHQQRRAMGGSNNKPDTSYFSVTGATDNFSRSTPLRADDGFSVTLASNEVNRILHYVSLSNLLIFTTGEEWTVRSDSRFSFDTVSLKPQSNWGSSHLRPVVVGSSVLFAPGPDFGTSVRSLRFSLEIDGYSTNEMSLLVPHLVRGHSIVEWAFARAADPVIYMVRDDGLLLTLTYNEEQEVIAWTTWDMENTNAKYESVAVIRPSASDDFDVPYFVVKRKINGNTVRYIERASDRIFTDVRDCFFVDSGLTLDSPIDISSITYPSSKVLVTATAHGLSDGDIIDLFDIVWESEDEGNGNFEQPDFLNTRRYVVSDKTTNTFLLKDTNGNYIASDAGSPTYVEDGTVRKAVQEISGLWHLINTDVTALADGNVISSLTIDSLGRVDLPRRFSRIHIGIPYISDVQTLDPAPAIREPIMAKKKKVSRVTVMLEKSRGLLVGPDADSLIEMKQRENENMSDPTALKTGPHDITITGEWKDNGELFLRQIYPLPLTVLAIVSDIVVGN